MPGSARTFNNMKLASIAPMEPDSVRLRTHRITSALSNRSHRQARQPLSCRLPPKMAESEDSKHPAMAAFVTKHRTRLLERRRSSIIGYTKQNYDVILSSLDCERMEELKHAFIQKNHELNFEQFVQVVWKFMNVKKGQEALVISSLLQLFEDIDINDDKKMQWTEFSDFLADKQRHSSDQEADLEKYEIDNFTKPFANRGANIQQLKYSQFYDIIAILLIKSKQITLFNHQKTEIINIIKGHSNHIICCEFLDGFQGIEFPRNILNDLNHNMGSKDKKSKDGNHRLRNMQVIIATSGLDEVINVWLITSQKKKPLRLRTISVNSVHNLIHWNHKRNMFVTADMDFNVNIWDNKLQNIIWQRKHHTNTIVDILLPNRTHTVITASLDATVVAYDLNYEKVKYVLGTHKRGLISMAYKDSLNILVTAAAEHSWYNFVYI